MESSGAPSSGSNSFVSESHRIVLAIDETERGQSHDWKNVQPVVMHSTKQLHQGLQAAMQRMDALESKVDQLLIAVSTLTHDRQVKEERYASDNRAFSRAWSSLQETLDQLRVDFERTTGAHTEAVRVLREITIPELERELDAVKEVHRVQARKEHRIEQLERDEEELRRHKVDADEFHSEIRAVKLQLEQLTLFPAFKTHVSGAGGASVSRRADDLGNAVSSWSDGIVSLSRWFWHGGSFGDAACAKAIQWDERLVRVGEAMRWSKTHPHVVKVDREGVYRVAVAVFYNGRDLSVPTLQVFVNNDAVLSALSSGSSSCILRRSGTVTGSKDGRGASKGTGACTRCRVTRCCCDPEALSSVSLQDYLFFPHGSVITVSYQGDPRNVTVGFLELQCLM